MKTGKWLVFRNLWALTFLSTGITLSILWGDTWYGFVAFLSGIACVFAAAVGSKHTYSIGTINAAFYGYVALKAGLNGEMHLNWLFYLPLQFVGFWMWSKQTQADGTVQKRQLNRFRFALIVLLSGLVTVLYGVFLKGFRGQVIPYVDSFTTIFSIAASILMLLRFREYWNLYIAVNVVSVVMWSHRVYDGVDDAITMLVMWVAFLVNSVYGWWVWNQKEPSGTEER